MYTLLSLICGVLLTFAFAPFNYWWLGVIALTGISLLWLNPKSDHPMRFGFCFGLGNFASGLYWVHISLNAYGGASWFFAMLANTALVFYLALYPLAVGAGLVLLRSRSASLTRALLIPLLWMSGEWLRSYTLTGFPWLSIGYTQLHGILASIVPIAGQFGAGLLLILISSLLAYAIVRMLLWPVLIVGFLFAVSITLQSLQFTIAIGNPLSVALVQGNTPPRNKFDPELISQDMQNYIATTSRRWETVIIWPETAVAFPEGAVRQAVLDPLDKLYYERDQTIVLGILSGNHIEKRYYNSVITLGRGSGRYDKEHLLPFGEFIPFKSLFGFFHDFVDLPMNGFSRGNEDQEPILTNGVPVGVSICFEAAFGRVVRQAMPDAQYLINVSNDGWFKDSIAGDQHLQMDQMRALELGREMARATNDGYTALINSQGEIMSELPRFIEGVLSGWIQPRIGLTPYARYGNTIFGYTLLLYAIIMALIYPLLKRHARAL